MEMIAKKSMLGRLSLVVLTRFAGIVFAMSFRVTNTAAHQTIVDFEIHKTLSNLSILTIRAIILTILKKKEKNIAFCLWLDHALWGFGKPNIIFWVKSNTK